MTARRKPGKPTLFSEQLAHEICLRITEGESLTKICSEKNMPGARTIYEWMERDLTFRGQYLRARAEQAHRWAEEIVEISDDSKGDYKIVEGKIVVDHENINRARLKVDARKWIVAKMLPRIYGDSVELESAGRAPVGSGRHEEMTDFELARGLAFTLRLGEEWLRKNELPLLADRIGRENAQLRLVEREITGENLGK